MADTIVFVLLHHDQQPACGRGTMMLYDNLINQSIVLIQATKPITKKQTHTIKMIYKLLT